MALTMVQAIEAARLAPTAVDWKVLASDVSPRSLERGKKGVFDEEQVSGIPETMAARFFTETSDGVAIHSKVKDRVVFRRLNLARPPFPMTGPLDAIFCHEGLQPLLPRVRRRVIDAAKALLAKDGIFSAGYDETSLDAIGDAEEDLWQEVARDLSRRHGNC